RSLRSSSPSRGLPGSRSGSRAWRRNRGDAIAPQKHQPWSVKRGERRAPSLAASKYSRSTRRGTPRSAIASASQRSRGRRPKARRAASGRRAGRGARPPPRAPALRHRLGEPAVARAAAEGEEGGVGSAAGQRIEHPPPLPFPARRIVGQEPVDMGVPGEDAAEGRRAGDGDLRRREGAMDRPQERRQPERVADVRARGMDEDQRRRAERGGGAAGEPSRRGGAEGGMEGRRGKSARRALGAKDGE